MTDYGLLDLVAEGREALAAPAMQRVHACLVVLPKLVDALDRVAQQQEQLREIRRSLTVKVGRLRAEVHAAQKMHPEATYRSGLVQRAIREIADDLNRLDGMLSDGAHG